MQRKCPSGMKNKHFRDDGTENVKFQKENALSITEYDSLCFLQVIQSIVHSLGKNVLLSVAGICEYIENTEGDCCCLIFLLCLDK